MALVDEVRGRCAGKTPHIKFKGISVKMQGLMFAEGIHSHRKLAQSFFYVFASIWRMSLGDFFAVTVLALVGINSLSS